VTAKTKFAGESGEIAEQAFERCKGAAEHGDVDAQVSLGIAYLDGRGVARNDAQAVDWFCRAAEQGNGEAELRLHRMYEDFGVWRWRFLIDGGLFQPVDGGYLYFTFGGPKGAYRIDAAKRAEITSFIRRSALLFWIVWVSGLLGFFMMPDMLVFKMFDMSKEPVFYALLLVPICYLVWRGWGLTSLLRGCPHTLDRMTPEALRHVVVEKKLLLSTFVVVCLAYGGASGGYQLSMIAWQQWQASNWLDAIVATSIAIFVVISGARFAWCELRSWLRGLVKPIGRAV
jgi:hypothetical protein